MIPVDDQKNLPEDENTPEKRAEKIWAFFGKKDNGNLHFISFFCFIKPIVFHLHKHSSKLFWHVLFPPRSQIKSWKENSFRAWWTTRTSCAWYNMMNRKKSKTSWKRRSNSAWAKRWGQRKDLPHVISRLFHFCVYIIWLLVHSLPEFSLFLLLLYYIIFLFGREGICFD